MSSVDLFGGSNAIATLVENYRANSGVSARWLRWPSRLCDGRLHVVDQRIGMFRQQGRHPAANHDRHCRCLPRHRRLDTLAL